jgi:hypothetical protein
MDLSDPIVAWTCFSCRLFSLSIHRDRVVCTHVCTNGMTLRLCHLFVFVPSSNGTIDLGRLVTIPLVAGVVSSGLVIFASLFQLDFCGFASPFIDCVEISQHQTPQQRRIMGYGQQYDAILDKIIPFRGRRPVALEFRSSSLFITIAVCWSVFTVSSFESILPI